MPERHFLCALQHKQLQRENACERVAGSDNEVSREVIDADGKSTPSRTLVLPLHAHRRIVALTFRSDKGAFCKPTALRQSELERYDRHETVAAHDIVLTSYPLLARDEAALGLEGLEDQPAFGEIEVVVAVPQGLDTSEADPLKTLRGRTSKWIPPGGSRSSG
jgi:hypothetical protein